MSEQKLAESDLFFLCKKLILRLSSHSVYKIRLAVCFLEFAPEPLIGRPGISTDWIYRISRKIHLYPPCLLASITNWRCIGWPKPLVHQRRRLTNSTPPLQLLCPFLSTRSTFFSERSFLPSMTFIRNQCAIHSYAAFRQSRETNRPFALDRDIK